MQDYQGFSLSARVRGRGGAEDGGNQCHGRLSNLAWGYSRQGVPLPVPSLDQEVVWAAGLDQSDPSRCAIGWGGNPTGGGYHGGVLIEQASGRVLDVVIGRHLR